jgi:hypothetical protein
MSQPATKKQTAKGPARRGPEAVGDGFKEMESEDPSILEPIEFGPELSSHAGTGPDSTVLPPANPNLKAWLVQGYGCPRNSVPAETAEAAAQRYFEAWNLNPARPISGLTITEES